MCWVEIGNRRAEHCQGYVSYQVCRHTCTKVDDDHFREEERVALAEKKHAEEVRFFTRTSQQLKAQLDGIRATKEK